MKTQLVVKRQEESLIETIAQLSVDSLIDEANLTPKPGLVDRISVGSHTDMTIETMHCSANALKETFRQMAKVSYKQKASQSLREELAEIGRNGEREMFKVTKGANTHKGAIWSLGLLSSAIAIHGLNATVRELTETAGTISRFNDRKLPKQMTNGLKVMSKYRVSGAVGEANEGFPHVHQFSLPALKEARDKGISENYALLDSLLALMAHLDDTCILHRGGAEALLITKMGAESILQMGGTSTAEGKKALVEFDERLVSLNVSPGGSADLLAVTLFLDRL